MRQDETDRARAPWTRRIGPLVSLVLFYAAVIYTVSRLLEARIVRWPFRRFSGLEEAYQSVGVYLAIAAVAAVSLVWLKASRIPIAKHYRISKPGALALGVAGLSIGYSAYLFAATDGVLQGMALWPPVLALSLMNAFSEETFYRVTLWGVLEKLTQKKWAVIPVQSLFYALPHYWIGGPRLALYALVYGLLLGAVRAREGSAFACIVCHFLIDIGNIGLPILAA